MSFDNDQQRLEFLEGLDEREEVTVTSWEAGFLSTCIDWGQRGFSEKQRAVIDSLLEKYGEED